MVKRFRGGIITANLNYTSVDLSNLFGLSKESGYSIVGSLQDNILNTKYNQNRIFYSIPNFVQYVLVAGGGAGGVARGDCC